MKRLIHALYLAAKHPRTPWYAKALAACVVAYALSPIDLIPDPIPVFGYLDDLVLLPLGIWASIRLIPDEIWTACRKEAARSPIRPESRSRFAALIIVSIWLLTLFWLARQLGPRVLRWFEAPSMAP